MRKRECVYFSVCKLLCLKTTYQVQTPNPFPHPLRKYKSHGILHLWLIVSTSQMLYCFIFRSPFLALVVLFPAFLFLLCVCGLIFVSVLSFLSFFSVLPPRPSILPPPVLLQTDWFQMLLNLPSLPPPDLKLLLLFLLSTLSTVEL